MLALCAGCCRNRRLGCSCWHSTTPCPRLLLQTLLRGAQLLLTTLLRPQQLVPPHSRSRAAAAQRQLAHPLQLTPQQVCTLLLGRAAGRRLLGCTQLQHVCLPVLFARRHLCHTVHGSISAVLGITAADASNQAAVVTCVSADVLLSAAGAGAEVADTPMCKAEEVVPAAAEELVREGSAAPEPEPAAAPEADGPVCAEQQESLLGVQLKVEVLTALVTKMEHLVGRAEATARALQVGVVHMHACSPSATRVSLLADARLVPFGRSVWGGPSQHCIHVTARLHLGRTTGSCHQCCNAPVTLCGMKCQCCVCYSSSLGCVCMHC